MEQPNEDGDLTLIEVSMFYKTKSKADFTVENILSFNQYFGRHGLPSSYVRPWRRKAVPSEILVKR